MPGDACFPEEWLSKRMMHPFLGEGIPDDELDAFWERISENYSDVPQGRMADDIVDCLLDLEVLGEDRSVLDIGCGPGTYALRLAPFVKNVHALDKSAGMIKRLVSGASDRGLENVEPIECDWSDYEPKHSFDVVFSALCPQTNDPMSILRMEDMSSRYCAYVSSMTEDADAPHFKIWRRMGKEYSYCGYDTRLPMRFLQSIDRDPVLFMFSEDPAEPMTTEDAVRSEKNSFSLFGRDDDTSVRMIREVIEECSENGMIIPKMGRRFGLLVWEIQDKTDVLGNEKEKQDPATSTPRGLR